MVHRHNGAINRPDLWIFVVVYVLVYGNVELSRLVRFAGFKAVRLAGALKATLSVVVFGQQIKLKAQATTKSWRTEE
jgi:hypothetical protein